MISGRYMVEHAKRVVRLFEARWASGRTMENFRGIQFPLVRPRFWNDTEPANFAAEIHPYFEHMPRLPEDSWVLDAGAASGHFGVAFGLSHPKSHIVAFEPSPRQRILLRRNLKMNGLIKRCTIHPLGLWNANTTLSFRTHGALSSVEPASQIPANYLFAERVKVVRLDDWIKQQPVPRLNLIKMDIEGAELEAIEGMTQTLINFKPVLLVQAYHLRDGARTLERCADLLKKINFSCHEADASGLLIANPQ